MVSVIVWIAVLAIAGYGVVVYNRLINLKNGIENTFYQIRVAMKKRLDMITSLVESTSSYLKFEKDVMENVTKMRNMNVNSVEDVRKADALATATFGKIVAIAENYPNLKGIDAVKETQNAIKDVEDEIARLRYLYNDMVQNFNMACERFPTNIFARLFGFSKREYLQFGSEIENRPSAKVY